MTGDKCKVCGKKVPEWPRGWLFLDDGRAFCPDHKGELHSASRKTDNMKFGRGSHDGQERQR